LLRRQKIEYAVRMKELIIHAGTPKTGTTTLQHCLFANREWLAERGYTYVLQQGKLGEPVPHHHRFAENLMHEDHSAASSFMQRTLSAKGTSIISSEVIYLGAEGGEIYKDRSDYWADRIRYLDRLRDMTAGARRTILLIFRRPDEFAESLYNTAVQQGAVWMPFNEFREYIADLVNYERQLALFRERFDNVLTLSYSDVRPQLTESVFSAMGMPAPPVRPSDQNTSADSRVIVWFLQKARGLTRTERGELRAFVASPACKSIFSDRVSLWEGEEARMAYCQVPGRSPVSYDMRMTSDRHVAGPADAEAIRIEDAFSDWRRARRSKLKWLWGA
jgi:hypothetical protein